MGAAPSVASPQSAAEKRGDASTANDSTSKEACPSADEVRRRRIELGLDDDATPAAPRMPVLVSAAPPALGSPGVTVTAGRAGGSQSSPFTSFQRRRIKLFNAPSVGSWKKGSIIGKGATGAVYEALDEATQGVFAVKEILFAEDFADNPEDRKRFDALRAEVSLLQQVDHPNVVRFLGIDRVGFNMYIMMDFVAGGNIQSLVNRFKRLPEELAAKYTFQIIQGLSYLHAKNIIHRDIKGANILVSDDGVVKLADFGAAKKILDPQQLQHTLAGTPYWMSPEVVRQQGHGKPADVWSLGATVLQMLTGKAPYQELQPVPALFKIGHSTDSPIPTDAQVTPAARDFLSKCLERDASKRAPLETLAEHSWLHASRSTLEPFYAGLPGSSCATSEAPSLQGSYRGPPPPDSPPAAAGQGRPSGDFNATVSTIALTQEEGLVMEYVIALSFTHDDEAAAAALLDAQAKQALFVETGAAGAGKGTMRAVTFDGDLVAPGDGDDPLEDDIGDGEFDQAQFEKFVGDLGKKR